MRIMFKRPAQFPLREPGKLSPLYEPDVEHTISDDIMEQIAESLLYRQLIDTHRAVIIKDTAPDPKAGKKGAKKVEMPADPEPEKGAVAAEGYDIESGGDETPKGDDNAPPVSDPKAGKKGAKKAKE